MWSVIYNSLYNFVQCDFMFLYKLELTKIKLSTDLSGNLKPSNLCSEAFFAPEFIKLPSEGQPRYNKKS